MTCSSHFRRYNAMGLRVFTGQKMFREKHIKGRDREFILCQGIDMIWKENQIKLYMNYFMYTSHQDSTMSPARA